jgi:hypothetical protein
MFTDAVRDGARDGAREPPPIALIALPGVTDRLDKAFALVSRDLNERDRLTSRWRSRRLAAALAPMEALRRRLRSSASEADNLFRSSPSPKSSRVPESSRARELKREEARERARFFLAGTEVRPLTERPSREVVDTTDIGSGEVERLPLPRPSVSLSSEKSA